MIGKKINQLATELAPESTDLTIIGDPTTGVSKKITLAQLGAIFSGAVSFYTNLASFPATGDINVIYCAKDTQKLYLWTGSAYVEVFPSQALLDTYQLRSEKGNANGYASLDSQGKVPISQLPSSIMEYKGTWNASTNTPTLANGTGDTGDVYICNVAGTVNFGAGPITFAVGDYVIYSGTIWQRSSGAVGTVTSVAASITGDSVTISGSPVTTSGTLAFAFAGTGAQYIKGDGTLATFPTTIDQAKNLITEVYNSTGATLTKGTVVYINGGQGNLPTVTKALASGDSTSAQTYGIVQSDITNMNNGFVVVAGRLADIDTSAFSVGTQLYLSSTTAGAYTSTKQYAPAHLVYVGIIVRSHPTQGIIEVKIQNGYELDELHNVAAQTPTNNDGLFWESATSLWKNKSIATVLGYTPANAATYVPYTGATANVDLGAFDLISRSAYLEGTASYQAGLLIKQRGLYNFVTGAYTQIVADSATDLNIVHNQANTTRRRYALSVAALQDGDSFQYLLPRANGTFALTSDLTGGTVTSVAALTIGTSGTDLSSTVANGTTTPVITLNVPTASATNRGALSSADWTTFNNKQNALTNPVTGTGTTNYLPKFTGTSTIGNSAIFENGTNVGINTASPSSYTNLTTLTINGTNGSVIDLKTGNTLYGEIYSLANELRIDAVGASSVLKFLTNSVTRATLDASGNLGLGTTNPNTLLSLVGNHAGGQSILKIQSSTAYSSSGLSSIGFNDSDGSRKSIIYTNTNGLQLETGTATPIIFNPNGTTALTLANGGAATFTSSVTTSGGGFIANMSTTNTPALTINRSSTSYNGIIKFQNGASDTWILGNRNTGDETFRLYNYNVGADVLIFANTGAATFSSSVTAGGNIIAQADLRFGPDLAGSNTGIIKWTGSGATYPNALGIFTWADGKDIQIGGSNVIFATESGGARMKITSGGSVGIGTTSPGSYALATEYGGSAAAVISIKNSSASGYSGAHFLNNSGSLMGHFGYANASTGAPLTDKVYFGSIASKDVVFTTNDTEKMRITSGGTVCVKRTTSPSSAYSMAIQEAIAMYVNANGNNMINFFNASETYVSSIVVNASSVAYNTSSDYRLKQDLKDFNGLDLISKLKAYDYEWKSDKSRSYGVIAHELQSVINYAVTGVKDGEQMQGVDYSKIVPVLIKAIQELNDKIK